MTDGWTDRQTHGEKQYVSRPCRGSLPTLSGGDIIKPKKSHLSLHNLPRHIPYKSQVYHFLRYAATVLTITNEHVCLLVRFQINHGY